MVYFSFIHMSGMMYLHIRLVGETIAICARQYDVLELGIRRTGLRAIVVDVIIDGLTIKPRP